METVVEARDLIKKFNTQVAVDKLRFSIQRGECYGILGANGAGKSTLMRMIYGSCLITAGELFVLGMMARDHMSKIKARLGVVPQDNALDTDLNVADNLNVFTDYHGMETRRGRLRAGELLRTMGLDNQAMDSVDTLSGGMRRKLAIARALLNDPELLILDEPTTGLDPQARSQLWEMIEGFKKAGKTVILTTHYMEEAEELCDRLLIMEKGRSLCEGTPEELILRVVGREVVEFSSDPEDVEFHVRKFKDQFDYQILNNRVRLFMPKLQEGRELIQQIASDRIQVRRANLNDVFLKLAGYEMRDVEINHG